MIEIKNIIQLHPIRTKNYDLLFPYVNNAISELLKLNEKIEFLFENIGVIKPKIYLMDNHTNNNKKHSIVFEFNIENNTQYYDPEYRDAEDINEDEKSEYFKSDISEKFAYKIFCFLILTQIAKPGTFLANKGDIYIDGTPIEKSFPLINIIQESYIYNQTTIKWPNLVELSYFDVLDWFNKYNFSFERYSNNNTELALNAFTRLFKNGFTDIEFDLIWSLIGIEALYCSSKEGIGEQIFQKSQVVLGDIKDFKKRLKEMYNFRSTLIHGSLNITPQNLFIENDDHDIFNENLDHSTFLAVTILIATFQKMIILDKDELVFDLLLRK